MPPDSDIPTTAERYRVSASDHAVSRVLSKLVIGRCVPNGSFEHRQAQWLRLGFKR
jgi:hypothetical protein